MIGDIHKTNEINQSQTFGNHAESRVKLMPAGSNLFKKPLFDSYRFCQISWLIDIVSSKKRNIISQELR